MFLHFSTNLVVAAINCHQLGKKNTMLNLAEEIIFTIVRCGVTADNVKFQNEKMERDRSHLVKTFLSVCRNTIYNFILNFTGSG